MLGLALAVLTDRANACGPDPKSKAVVTEPAPGATCKTLLRALNTLDKLTWSDCRSSARPVSPPAITRRAGAALPLPPPPPPPVLLATSSSLAQCRLLDPSNKALDDCLVDAIADTALVDSPLCPTSIPKVAIGDVAFFILGDRHPGLWNTSLPGHVVARQQIEGVRAFQQWIVQPGSRRFLQKATRDKLNTETREK